MNTEKTSLSKPPFFPLKVSRTLVMLGFAVLLGGAFMVPFYYETQTLWYKIGGDKLMLRVGQLAGLLALVLLFTQIILALRAKFLEKLFGTATLMRWHKTNGMLIVSAALTHVGLVLAPEGMNNLPIGTKYWPEMVGGGLFLLLFITVISSHFRSILHLSYLTWKRLHVPLGYLALMLSFIHVLFVSESFSYGFPRFALIILFSGMIIVIAIIRLGRLKINKMNVKVTL